MKKFFYLLLSVLSILAMTSCSSKETPEMTQLQTEEISEANIRELMAISNRLDSLNRELGWADVNEPTRAQWWDKIKAKIGNIVACDAIGALFGSPGGVWGGLIGGAAFSAVAAFTDLVEVVPYNHNPGGIMHMCHVNPDSISLSSNIVHVNENEYVQMSDSIGYYHNAILINMNISLCNDQLMNRNIISNLTNNVASRFDVPLEMINEIIDELKPAIKINEEILLEFSEDDSFEDVINRWKLHCPEISHQLDVLASFINGLVQIPVDENDGTYLNESLSIVNGSGLSKKSMSELRNAMIVANASYQLWNVGE